MKWKGKIALWFWAVYGIANGACIYGGVTSPDSWGGIALGLVLLNLIFLPILIRNYVEIKEDKIILVFGFSKESIPIGDVKEVYRTRNPIASSAASLDRIVIKGRRQEIICSIQGKEEFFAELKKRNRDILFRV